MKFKFFSSSKKIMSFLFFHHFGKTKWPTNKYYIYERKRETERKRERETCEINPLGGFSQF